MSQPPLNVFRHTHTHTCSQIIMHSCRVCARHTDPSQTCKKARGTTEMAHTHTHTHTHTHAHTHTHTHAITHTHTHARSHTHTNAHTHTHAKPRTDQSSLRTPQ